MEESTAEPVKLADKMHGKICPRHRPIPKARFTQSPGETSNREEVRRGADEVLNGGRVRPCGQVVEGETQWLRARSISHDAWGVFQLMLDEDAEPDKHRQHPNAAQANYSKKRYILTLAVRVRDPTPREAKD